MNSCQLYADCVKESYHGLLHVETSHSWAAFVNLTMLPVITSMSLYETKLSLRLLFYGKNHVLISVNQLGISHFAISICIEVRVSLRTVLHQVMCS
jgi:hypothetical protein